MSEQNTTGADVWGDGALTVGRAVEVYGLGRTVLYAMMAEGRLPYSKVGTRRLIPRRALVALLASGQSGTTRPAA
jgi:excisionase family DNA binding protein